MPVEMMQMWSGSSVLKCKPSMFEALDRQRQTDTDVTGSDVLGARVIFVFFSYLSMV